MKKNIKIEIGIEIGMISEVKWFIAHRKWKYTIGLKIKYVIQAINNR